MAPIVAPNIARFSLTGQYADQPVATILDLRPAQITGGPTSREAFLSTMANELLEIWADFIAPFSTALTYSGVNYVDMDSAEGTVGYVGWPVEVTGDDSEAAFPGNVAVRFNKSSTGFQRGQRAGRMYIAGGIENWTLSLSPNTLTGAVQTSLQASADAFMAALDGPFDDGDGGTFSTQLMVVHTTRATPESDPVFSGATVVSSLVIQSRLASQRRRLTL
jgi:hypothetical protein